MISAGNQQPHQNSNAVVLSAGGTGGHMFPAFALARELKERGFDVSLVTDARGEKYRTLYTDLFFHIVRADTMRPGILAKFKMAIDLVIGTGQAYRMLKKVRPRAVIGFGGYPSFPAVIAAQLLRIPTMIHEQNAVLGLANKIVAGSATRIALGVPDLSSIPEAWKAKTIVTGNPVRADIAAIGEYVMPGEVFRILVLGGSQGASVFSKIVPQAVAMLPEALKRRVSIVQQCRAGDMAGVRHAYDVMGVNARLETFINDVPQQLGACHLLIARSGASTVTEAAVAGRPALFVPYPHHKDQQQKRNADVLVRAGAAKVMDEKTMTPQSLSKELENLMSNPADLAAMAVSARKALESNASKRLADAIMAL